MQCWNPDEQQDTLALFLSHSRKLRNICYTFRPLHCSKSRIHSRRTEFRSRTTGNPGSYYRLFRVPFSGLRLHCPHPSFRWLSNYPMQVLQRCLETPNDHFILLVLSFRLTHHSDPPVWCHEKPLLRNWRILFGFMQNLLQLASQWERAAMCVVIPCRLRYGGDAVRACAVHRDWGSYWNLSLKQNRENYGGGCKHYRLLGCDAVYLVRQARNHTSCSEGRNCNHSTFHPPETQIRRKYIQSAKQRLNLLHEFHCVRQWNN
jgi:hypothetical protein